MFASWPGFFKHSTRISKLSSATSIVKFRSVLDNGYRRRLVGEAYAY